MSASLASWQFRLAQLVNFLNNLPGDLQELSSVPSGDSPEETIQAYLEVLALLGAPPLGENSLPAKAVYDRFANTLDAGKVATICDTFSNLVSRLDTAIATALASSKEGHPQLVHTADFNGGISVQSTASSFLPIAYGHLDALPSDHYLRQVFQPEDCFQSAQGPLIVLGLTGGSLSQPVARKWYPLAFSRRLTAERRQRQRKQEDAERQDEARKRAAEEERRRHLPLTPAEHVRQLEENLRAAGIKF